jgi:Tol biopolymer transport system component
VAIEYEQPAHHIWIYDLKGNSATQFTFGSSAQALPVWSNDGKRIAYAAERGNYSDLFAKAVAGTQAEEGLLESNDHKYPLDWSRDGNVLLYLLTNDSNSYSELRALPMQGSRNSVLVLKSPLYDGDGQFSPSAHWVAYTSREQGPSQVFATPFPGPGPRVRISLASGNSPVWRKDGRAILYMNDSGTVLEETEVQERGPELLIGKTRHLAALTGMVPAFQGSPFDTGRDGRILFLSRGEQNTTQLVMVANWSEGMK